MVVRLIRRVARADSHYPMHSTVNRNFCDFLGSPPPACFFIKAARKTRAKQWSESGSGRTTGSFGGLDAG